MAKKRKTCPKCRKKLFNIESNYKACSNINCDYTSLDSEIGSIYFPYFMYEDSRTPDLYSMTIMRIMIHIYFFQIILII